jgi:hypothetical protein
MPVKHGNNTETISEKLTPSVYLGPQLLLRVCAERPVTEGDTPGRGAAINPA